jgi:fructokinase
MTVCIAAVEGGGTSFVVSVASVASSTSISTAPNIMRKAEIDSSHDQPHKTLKECAEFFRTHRPQSGYDALGIAMFGPVGLDKSKPREYGKILASSPKASWRNVDFLTPLQEACHAKAVQIDTDVNAPALAEFIVATEREKKNISSIAYVTVGTGIGVGLVINSNTVHGMMHPEGGHVTIQCLPGDTFGGYSWGEKSPYNGKGTVEGMASSVALTERLERMENKTLTDRNCLANLPDNHELWEHAANALANLCTTLILTTSIEKIVLGGGVMKRPCLIDKIRKRVPELINGYLDLPQGKGMEDFIALSSFGSDVGLVGAVVLAQRALLDQDPDLETKKLKDTKQTAYGVGLKHGFLVGLVTALVAFRVASKRIYKKR